MTSIKDDAAVTVNKLQRADVTNDFSEVFDAIKQDARQYNRNDFQEYLRNVNEALTQKQYLPSVTIAGFDAQNNKLNVKINGQEMTLDTRTAVTHLDRNTLEANLRRNRRPQSGDGNDTAVLSKQLDNGCTLKFDEKGRATESTIPGYGKISYTRDAEGKVVEATHTNNAGQVIRSDRQEAGKWVSIQGGTRRELPDVTSADVNRNGDLVLKQGTGHMIQKISDGSTTTYDQSGNVTKINYRDGGSRTFAYENGNLKSVEFDNNRGYKDSYKLQADGTWQNFDSAGRPTAHKLNQLSVSKDGVVTEKGKDASSGRNFENVIGTDHQKHDATRTKINSDGSKVTVESGKVTDVVCTNGVKKHFEYNSDGSIKKIEVTTQQGTAVWENSGNDKWKRQGTTTEYQGVTTVDGQGNVLVKYPSGNSLIEGTNGSSVNKNDRGQITSIQDRHGVKREFAYGTDGKVSEIKYTNGAFQDSWKREGGSWNNYDASGRPTGRALANIDVRPDGTLIEHDKNTNRIFVSKTDGSAESRKVPPGADVSREPIPGDSSRPGDRSSPPSHQPPRETHSWHEVRRHAMETQKGEIAANGSRKIQQGDTLWDIARANLEVQNSGARSSNQDVAQEVRRLANVNNIRDVNRIPIGTEIKMRNR